MAVIEQRRTESDFGSESGSGRGATLCRADELKGFIQQLSDQIADADRRHSGVLRDMLERLSRLGGQTETLKATLPKEFSADLERLEDGMASLALRIAESDQARQPEAVQPVAVQTVSHAPMAHQDEPASQLVASPSTFSAQSDPEPEPAPAPSWSDPSRAAFLTSPPALKSAVNAQSGTAWSRPESPLRPADLQTAVAAAPVVADASDDPWDSQSAEALTKLYDSGEPGLPPMHAVSEMHPPQTPVLALVQAIAPAAAPATQAAQAPMAIAPVSSEPVSLVSGKELIEREWLDARLNDIADRVEQSLAGLTPEISLADIGHRFDQLEERFSGALTDVATRSDVEGLRLVEAHIAELAQRLAETQSQLARLDQIEAQLTELGAQLTDGHMVQLFGNLIPTEADLTHFAEQAGERVATRFLAEMPVPQVAAAMPVAAASLSAEALEIVQAAHADSTEQIGALQQMLAGFIDERRRGEAETAEALETMQHAMQHVLDRVDALDNAGPARHAPTPAEVFAHSPGQKPMGLPSQASFVQDLDAGETIDQARAAAKAAAAAAASRSKTGLPGGTQVHAEPGRRIEPALDQMPHDAESQIEANVQRGAAARAGSGGSGDRRSVIENARRAAANAKPAAAALEEAPKPKAPSVRDRLLGGAGGSEQKGVSRQALLLVPILSAVLVGVWIFATQKKNRPMPPTAAIEDIVPVAPAAKPGEKLEMAPALAPADGLDTKPAQPAVPALKKPDERSELPAMRGRSLPEQARDFATETGSITRSEAPSGGARVVAGPVPGMAIQQTGRLPSLEETMRAREKMQLASLSQRTAWNAAETAAVPPSAVPAALQDSDAVAAPAAEGGKPVVELPPALVGPLSLRLAASKGDPSAQFEVAARFAEGKGIKQDFVQAATWYQRAAAQGQATAQYRLAALYERGLGVKADPARARLWYKRAAEQGSVKAMHNLAVLSASRDQGSADYPTAVQWFGEAAERGLSDSQYNLGVLYESGLGVPKDLVAAYKWYSIAARSGDGEAIRRQQIVRNKLDAVTLQGAEESIEGWRAQPMEGVANDAVAAGVAWKTRAAN